ncbi:MAG: transcriptional regulator [Planctomycetes bacterium]|nr:transcriptional regulator [Planctomycetota bacterium]
MKNKKADPERGKQFVRQWTVLRQLEALKYGITAEELGSELGYSKRTIYRDLQVLKDAGFPLENEKIEGRIKWRLGMGYKTFNVPLTYTELMALCFSKNLLAALDGTLLKTGVDSAMEKITNSLPEETADFVFETEQTLVPKINPCRNYKGSVDVMDNLLNAARRKNKCRITYRAEGHKRPDDKFHPYALTYHNGQMYCVGFSELRNAVRTFSLHHIKKVNELGEKFAMEKGRDGADFNVNEYLDESFGIWHEGTVEDVALRFSKEYAGWIQERAWHPTQKFRNLPNGELEMTMHVSGMNDIIRWLLPMGDNARVLKPKKLADEIVGISKNIVKSYER